MTTVSHYISFFLFHFHLFYVKISSTVKYPIDPSVSIWSVLLLSVKSLAIFIFKEKTKRMFNVHLYKFKVIFIYFTFILYKKKTEKNPLLLLVFYICLNKILQIIVLHMVEMRMKYNYRMVAAIIIKIIFDVGWLIITDDVVDELTQIRLKGFEDQV